MGFQTCWFQFDKTESEASKLVQRRLQDWQPVVHARHALTTSVIHPQSAKKQNLSFFGTCVFGATGFTIHLVSLASCSYSSEEQFMVCSMRRCLPRPDLSPCHCRRLRPSNWRTTASCRRFLLQDKSVPHWSMTWLATHLHLLHATWRGGRSLETDVEFGELVLPMFAWERGYCPNDRMFHRLPACAGVRLCVELGNLVVPVEC